MGFLAIFAGSVCGVAIAALISRTMGLYNVRAPRLTSNQRLAAVAERMDDNV